MYKKADTKFFFHYLLPYRMKLFGVLLALLITSSTVLVMSHSIGYVIDHAIVTNDRKTLDLTLMAFVGIAVVLAIATGIRYSLVTLTAELVTKDIRRDLYAKILSLTPEFYEDGKTGEILSNITTDATTIRSVLSSTCSVAMRNLVMLVGSLIMLAVTSIKLTIMLILVVPLVIAPIIYFGRKAKKVARVYQDKIAELAAYSEEAITCIKTIQSYTREAAQQDFFDNLLINICVSASKRIFARAVLTCTVICLIFGGIGLVLWLGSIDVLSGMLSPGQLSNFIFLSLICATTAMALTEAFGEIQRASGASARIIEFLNLEPHIQNPRIIKALPIDNPGLIKFSNVTFHYATRAEKPALHNVDFQIQPGSTTALVGESGAGKSTIMQLLLRFYDIQNGSITIDDIDIKDLDLKVLRNHFSYVSQDSVIFSATVYDNIAYGNPDASENDIISAAKAASAWRFIEKLPHGLKAFLGEKGSRLSGGQRQRIAIARAILKNPKILLLDEATSALDMKNEISVQKALHGLMMNRTTVVIAHSLNTIIKADKIIFLGDGQVIKQGTHLELITSCNEYREHFAIIEQKEKK